MNPGMAVVCTLFRLPLVPDIPRSPANTDSLAGGVGEPVGDIRVYICSLVDCNNRAELFNLASFAAADLFERLEITQLEGIYTRCFFIEMGTEVPFECFRLLIFF